MTAILTFLTDANNLKIPDEVMKHPSILALGEATNDLVTWSNVSHLASVADTDILC